MIAGALMSVNWNWSVCWCVFDLSVVVLLWLVICQMLSLVRRFLSTQVSLCGDTLLPCSRGSEGPHGAHTCWNCRSVLTRHLVMQSNTSGVAGYSVEVPVGAWRETFIIDGWWQWCGKCWAEGIKRFVVAVVMYTLAVLLLYQSAGAFTGCHVSLFCLNFIGFFVILYITPVSNYCITMLKCDFAFWVLFETIIICPFVILIL